jgi:prevent-host-death family protein
MKTITLTLTELKKHLGEVMFDIRREGANFLITQRGKPIARLLPIDSDRRITHGKDSSKGK